MQNEQFITIQGWMRNELELKGNELLVYALIYGFSQDEESEFTGSIGYIADWTGATKQTIHNTLKSLQEKELLHKEESFIKGVKYCSYRAILPPVKKFDGGSQKILPGVVKKFDGGSQKILPNSIEDNIERKNNTRDNKYSDVPDYLLPAFMEWGEMRKKIRKPIPSEKTVTRALNKLYKLSDSKEKQIAIIEQSIDKNWLSFYSLHEDRTEQEPKVKDASEVLKEYEGYREKAVQMPDEIRTRLNEMF